MKTKTLLVILVTFAIIVIAALAIFFYVPKDAQIEELADLESPQIELFNGSNLDGWGFVVKDDAAKPSDVFTVKDGVIDIAGDPFGYMFTEQEFADFQLHVEWRWPEEATNSGIFLLVQDDRKAWPNAIECQLKAGDAGSLVMLGGSDLVEYQLPEGQERPAYPMILKQAASSENPVGEWNSADITNENGTLTIYINGVFQNKATNAQHKQGRIGLQSEGKEICFRNVRVTPLK
jgi:hypothetical protein